MKQFLVISLIVCLLMSLCCAAGAAGVTRHFGMPPGQPKGHGFAEVELVNHRADGRESGAHSRIWFDGRNRYRVESETSSSRSRLGPMRIYNVMDRGHLLALPWVGPRGQWMAMPPSVLGEDYLDHRLQPSVTLQQATLVGTEQVHGLRCEHWRGVFKGKRSTQNIDLWVSIDPRFPLVLKVLRKSPSGHWSTWQAKKLDITSPLPPNIFTAQFRPQPGLLALLRTRFWPPWLFLAWYVVLLACNAGLALSLARVAKGTGWNGILPSLAFAAITLGMIGGVPTLQEYVWSYADIPWMLAMFVITAAVAFAVWRRTGAPGGLAVFRGAGWPGTGFAFFAGLFGTAASFMQYASLSLALHLPAFAQAFLPATLANVFVQMLSIVTVEEIIFRGYLQNALETRLARPGLANIMQALVFAAYHIPRELVSYRDPGHLTVGLVWVFVFGLVFGALRTRYRSLAVPWMAHLFFNVARAYFFYAISIGFAQGLTAGLK